MKRLIIFLLLPCSVLAQDLTARIDSVVSAYAKMERFNGSVLVAQKNKIIFEKGYGYKDASRRETNTVNTIFQIGSVTKQFTSTVILKLQEQGKLSIKDKLTKYFPDYPNGDSITIENLLTHTSGIFNYTNDAQFMSAKATSPADMNTMVALFRDKPLNFSPGSKFEYSNSGYSLLGYIIEKASGKTYEQMVREMIFQPLGMKQSGFDFTHLRDQNKATGYFVMRANSQTPATIVDSSVAFSAGSIYSSAADLFTWSKAVNEGKLLKPASWSSAFTPYKNKYGFGWVMDTVFDHKQIAHNGGIFGFTSQLVRIPDDGIVIVLLSNASNGGMGEISTNILATLYGKPVSLPHPKKEVVIPVEQLNQYVGEYELSPTFKLKFSIYKEQLVAQATGQLPFELAANGDHNFTARAVPIQIEFKPDSSGKIVSLIFLQAGRRVPAKKIN